MNTLQKTLTATLLLGLPAIGAAEGVPNTFAAGTPASAAEVNENFSSLESRIAALESQMGGDITAESLQGTYRLHISGSLYEFFDFLAEDGSEQSHPMVENFAHRDFLNAGNLVLEAGGEFTYQIDNGIEMTAFHRNFSNKYEDETDVSGSDTVSGTWEYNSSTNIVTATFSEGGDGLAIPFHVSTDQNTLLGAVFIDEVFSEAEFDENIHEYEIVNVNAIRLPQ